MLKILNGTKEDIRKNIEILAKDYFEKTGRKVCRTCPSDIQYMILSLKNIYKMTNFAFKKHAAQYKNKKGDRTTISNSTMTDERAIEFLKTNPKRIELFGTYPKNWKKLVSGKAETPEQIEARLAIEAELALAAEANKKDGLKVVPKETEAEKQIRLSAEAEAAAIAAASGSSGETPEQIEARLMKMKLGELRKEYPEVKATSIKAFVNKVLNS